MIRIAYNFSLIKVGTLVQDKYGIGTVIEKNKDSFTVKYTVSNIPEPILNILKNNKFEFDKYKFDDDDNLCYETKYGDKGYGIDYIIVKDDTKYYYYEDVFLKGLNCKLRCGIICKVISVDFHIVKYQLTVKLPESEYGKSNYVHVTLDSIIEKHPMDVVEFFYD